MSKNFWTELGSFSLFDVVSLMQTFGFERFCVLAHDRGARVAHRLAVDHPAAVQKMILLDIAPTLAMYEQTNEDFARAYWRWFFLIRPAPFPETLIEADPEGYLRSVMGTRSAGMSPFADSVFAEYLRCLAQTGAARGICEDYRASAGIERSVHSARYLPREEHQSDMP